MTSRALTNSAVDAALAGIAAAYTVGDLDRMTDEEIVQLRRVDELMDAAILSGDSWAIRKTAAIWQQIWLDILSARVSTSECGVSAPTHLRPARL